MALSKMGSNPAVSTMNNNEEPEVNPWVMRALYGFIAFELVAVLIFKM
jgi:hypothetical protein